MTAPPVPLGHRAGTSPTGPGGLRSALYEGTVTHVRRAEVDRRFSYRVTMTLLDLDEVDEVAALHPLWSVGRTNVVSFRRADFLGDPGVPLARAVRDLVEARTGRRPAGPIALLTHLRTWGWLFNPISVYYCYDPTGTEVEQVVAEVSNTPWHERIRYVLPGPGTHRVAKELHVSPFLPMELDHVFTIGAPGDRLVLGVDDHRRGTDADDGADDGLPVFAASLVLDRVAATRRSLGRALWRFPLMTVKVSAAIYGQALALRLRGVRVHPHPDGRVRNGGEW